MVKALLVLALIACRAQDDPRPHAPPPPSPAALATYLDAIAAYPPAARAAEMARWKLDRAAWNRIVVEPFRSAYDDYDRGFDAAIGRVALHAGVITTRRHFAGDPDNTVAETWLRWALPTLYPSAVAAIDGAQLDLVFVYDGEGWRTLAGLDRIIVERGAAMDPACPGYLDGVAAKSCAEVGYLIASAAIQRDRAAFDRACLLAASRCGKRSK